MFLNRIGSLCLKIGGYLCAWCCIAYAEPNVANSTSSSEPIRVVGSDLAAPVLKASFKSLNETDFSLPVQIDMIGSKPARKQIESQTAEIAIVAEKNRGKAKDYDGYDRYLFAFQPALVITHQDNPLSEIQLEVVGKLLSPDGGLRSWGDLGLRGEWTRRDIKLMSLSPARSMSLPLLVSRAELPPRVLQKNWNYHEEIDSMIAEVASQRRAIAITGWLPERMRQGIKILPVSSKTSDKSSASSYAVRPSISTIKNDEYPLSFPLVLYVKKADESKEAFDAGSMMRSMLAQGLPEGLKSHGFLPVISKDSF